MPTYLSYPVTGNADQAYTQLVSRVEGAFTAPLPQIQFVAGADGTTTEFILIFADATPAEQITAFRRAFSNISERPGLALTAALGSGGVVATDETANFNDGIVGQPPPGFEIVGSVTVAGSSGGVVNSGPSTIYTDGGGAGTLDLSTVDITNDLPIDAGTLSIALNQNGVGAETITDDGAGNLTGSGTSLPGGGTINYFTGAMTGTTANLTASSSVTETHDSTQPSSPTSSIQLASGGAAGTTSITSRSTKLAGADAATLAWALDLNFGTDFGLNNNTVTGAQSLLLEMVLVGALPSGRDIVLQWTATTSDTTPPTAWGTPTFSGVTPVESPTAALAVAMDGGYEELLVDYSGSNTLRVALNGTAETFTFTGPLRVPTSVTLRHTWGATLDRSFLVDNWSYAYTV